MKIPLDELKKNMLAQFTCQQTGNCCRNEGFVYVTEDDIAHMASLLKLDLSAFKDRFVERHNGWSVVASPTFRPNCFLDANNGCKVYEARPEHCKTYPNWPEIWESEASLQKELLLCKGLRQAYERCLNNGNI